MHSQKFPRLLNLNAGISSLILTTVFSVFLILGFQFFAFYQFFIPPASLEEASKSPGYVIVFPAEIHGASQKITSTFDTSEKSFKNPLLKNQNGLDAIDLVGRESDSKGESWQFAESEKNSIDAISDPAGNQSQSIIENPSDIRDARAFIDHILSYIDDVIFHEEFTLESFSPLLSIILPEDDPGLRENMVFMTIKLARDSQMDQQTLLNDIKGVIPEASIYSKQDFFGPKVVLLHEIGNRFFYGLLFMGFGLLTFLLVMIRNMFEQHRCDSQTLAFIGASNHCIKNIFFMFFQKRFVRGFLSASVISVSIFLVLLFASGLGQVIEARILDLLIWVGFYAICSGFVFFVTLSLVLRGQLRSLK